MENYNMAAHEVEKIYRKYIHERMKDINMTQYRLSQVTDLSESTISRWLKGESNITLNSFLRILGALEIRPYLIPAEDDDTEMQRMYFN